MSLPKCVKRYKKVSDNSEITITGSVFETGKSVPRASSVGQTDSGTKYNCTLTPEYANYTTVSSYLLEFYYDDSICEDVGAQLIKGTGYSSVQSFFEAIWDMLNDKFAHNQTQPSWKSLMTDSNFSAKEQGFLKSATSEYILFPTVSYYISTNDFNPGDMTRTVAFGVSVLATMSTWNTNNNAWNSSSEQSMTLFSFSGSGSDFTKIKESFDKISNSLHCIALSPGPYQSKTQTGSEVVFNAPNNSQDDIVAFYINEPVSTDGGYSYAMKRTNIGRLGTPAWNKNGSVDPVDPTPTPPDPEPYPPTPPIPPTPDPPIPVDPVDPVPIPTDPPIGEVGSGFVTVYNPDKNDINQLARKFWDQTVWDLLKQHFTNPFDAIIGLTIIPVTPDRVAGQPLVIGNYNTHIETNKVTSEYATMNCGNVYIPKFFNSYLDYDPYTKYQLYLPFIGEVALNADEITSKTINITYKVNVISGDCVAFLSINNSVFAEFNGNCARQITVTKGNLEEILSNAVQFAATAVSMGMSTAAAGSVGEAIESASTSTTGEVSNAGQIRLAGVEARMSAMGANTISAGINAVIGSKMGYSKAGNPGQGSGQISVRTPFITVTRPNLTLPENIDQASQSSLRHYVGYPTNKVGPLSSFHGLTIVEACQLNSQHATDGEIAEALEIMKGGVIL